MPQIQQIENPIQDAINQNDATHNQIVSNSVGMGILTLLNNYQELFGNNDPEKVEQQYQLFVTAFTEHANHSEDAELIRAAQGIIRNADAGLDPHGLDVLTLYLRVNDTDQYEDVIHVFQLKLVLPLVWTAIHDNEKFIHCYDPSLSREERLTAANNDLENRLLSYTNNLKSLYTDGICHTGIRHELMFILNKSYAGMDFIETALTTIFEIIRAELSRRVLTAYETEQNPVKKRELFRELLTWIKTKNAVNILLAVDPADTIRKELHALIKHHGSNPVSESLDAKFDNALPGISFDCDREKFPLLVKINSAFNLFFPDEANHCSRAIAVFQDWLQNTFELNNPEHEIILNHFVLIVRAAIDLSRHKILIRTYGIATEYFREQMRAYHEAIINNDIRPDEVTAGLTLEFNARLKEFQSNTKFEEIKDFFENWHEQDIFHFYPHQNRLYKMLLDPDFTRYILFKDDAEVIAFASHAEVPAVRPDEAKPEEPVAQERKLDFDKVTAYDVNRVILNGILVAPENWSPAFKKLYSAVYLGISANFKNGNFYLQPFTQMSYLSQEYDYYHNDVETGRLVRPTKIFVMPEQVQTAGEWVWISLILDNKKSEELYLTHRVRINAKQVKYLRGEGQSTFPIIVASIPKNHRLQFLALFTEDEIVNDFIKCVKTISSFYLLGITEEAFLDTIITARVLKKIIQNNDDFKTLLYEIPNDYLITYFATLQRAELDFEIVTGGITVGEFLRNTFLRLRQPLVTADLSTALVMFIRSIIKKSTEVASLLTSISENIPQHYFLDMIIGKELLSKILVSLQDFMNILNVIKPDSFSQVNVIIDKIFSDLKKLTAFLEGLGDDAVRIKFLRDVLCIEFLMKVLPSPVALSEIMKTISAPQRLHFLTEVLGMEFVKTLIKSAPAETYHLIFALDVADRSGFIAATRPEYLTAIVASVAGRVNNGLHRTNLFAQPQEPRDNEPEELQGVSNRRLNKDIHR